MTVLQEPQPAAAWKPQLHAAEMRYAYVGFGTLVCCCFVPDLDCPIGTTWCVQRRAHDGRTAYDIVDVYVVHFARRCGVAKWMLSQLLAKVDMLRTDTGTKDGGLELIRSFGFELDETAGVWIATRK